GHALRDGARSSPLARRDHTARRALADRRLARHSRVGAANPSRVVPMTDGWEPDVSRVALGDRSLFTELEPFAYLAHAAISPASSEVRRAALAVADDYARHGFGAF